MSSNSRDDDIFQHLTPTALTFPYFLEQKHRDINRVSGCSDSLQIMTRSTFSQSFEGGRFFIFFCEPERLCGIITVKVRSHVNLVFTRECTCRLLKTAFKTRTLMPKEKSKQIIEKTRKK